MKGFEAYEFHDRNASIVTVGSFNSMGTPLPDGRTDLDPRIVQIIDTFRAKPSDKIINDPAAQGPFRYSGSDLALKAETKSLVGINFDIQPIPVQVPKMSLSAGLSRRPAEREKIDFRE